ncbi:MAG TPA: response regulator [Pyrinomonadaceae bacterium]|nr:response regulator [Pyrinomonadaceae bacterium]
MPGEDGYALIRKVRELEEPTGKRLPAVALTAFARTEDRVQALAAGFNMHVPKPAEPAELALVISSLVK